MKNAFRNLFVSILGLAACLAVGVIAYAAVTIDEDGFGFVGKGDVQAIFDWNNADLQENAALLDFRFVGGTTTTWTCQRNGAVQTQERTHFRTIDSSVIYDARKNKVNQI